MPRFCSGSAADTNCVTITAASRELSKSRSSLQVPIFDHVAASGTCRHLFLVIASHCPSSWSAVLTKPAASTCCFHYLFADIDRDGGIVNSLFDPWHCFGNMPVQTTDSPAVEAGSTGTPAADALEASQISRKATKRKLTDAQTTETVLEVHANTADTADAAARKRHAAGATGQQALNGPRASAQQLESGPDEQSEQQSPGSSGSDEQSEEGSEESEGGEGPRGHPYGVQPWGNFYLSQVAEIRTAGGPRCCSCNR